MKQWKQIAQDVWEYEWGAVRIELTVLLPAFQMEPSWRTEPPPDVRIDCFFRGAPFYTAEFGPESQEYYGTDRDDAYRLSDRQRQAIRYCAGHFAYYAGVLRAVADPPRRKKKADAPESGL
jgi:hypothetical protein